MIEFRFCKIGYNETVMLLGAWDGFYDSLEATIAGHAIMTGKSFAEYVEIALVKSDKSIIIGETLKQYRKAYGNEYPNILATSLLDVVLKDTDKPLVTIDESGILDTEMFFQFLETYCMTSPEILQQFLTDIWVRRIEKKPSISEILKKKQELWQLGQKNISLFMKEVLPKL